MHRSLASLSLAALALLLPTALQAQTKDDFEYWDLNGNGDLTCAEATGKDEGLKLPPTATTGTAPA